MIKINQFKISFEPQIVKDRRKYFPWVVSCPGIRVRVGNMMEAIGYANSLIQHLSFNDLPF